MVLRTRIELVSPPWKGSVLTDKLTEYNYLKFLMNVYCFLQSRWFLNAWMYCNRFWTPGNQCVVNLQQCFLDYTKEYYCILWETLWSTEWDLNSRLYGFAIRPIGPLWHPCILAGSIGFEPMLPLRGGRLSKPLPSTSRPTAHNLAGAVRFELTGPLRDL